MATLRPRTLSDGTTVYDVSWRLGGTRDGAGRTETFNPRRNPLRGEKAAKFFKAALEANGHQWPANYAPGIGFIDAAELARRQAERERAQQRLLFRDHARICLAMMAPGVETATLRRYQAQVDNHMIPFFGDMDVCDPAGICPETIGPWITALRAGEREDPGDPLVPREEWPWLREPLSPKTIRNIHGLLYTLMQFLVDAEVPKRAKNPCKGTSLPSMDDGEGDEEMCFLDVEEYALLRAQFDDVQARDLADFLYGTGLRFSEATALQVRDFDVEGRRPGFRVRRAWKQAENGRYYLGPPKTKSSLRWVGLTDQQVEAVRPRLAGRREKDLIFTGPTGGRWTHSTFFTGRWRPAVYRAVRCVQCRGEDYAAGIGRRGPSTLTAPQIVWCGHEGQLQEPPRVHDLRHSHVAALIASGAHLLSVSRRLGHKGIEITYNRYGHLVEEVEDDMIARLGSTLARLGS